MSAVVMNKKEIERGLKKNRERERYVVLCGRLQPPNYRRLP